MFTATFLAVMMGTVVTGKLPFVVLLIYFVASWVAFLAYFFDKAAALKGQRRTRENTLHLFSLVGGWPGAMFAQQTLRHKTQKRSFQVTYWVTVVLNCAAFGWLLSPPGMRAVNSLMGVS